MAQAQYMPSQELVKLKVIATYLSMPHEVSTTQPLSSRLSWTASGFLVPKPMARADDIVDYDESRLQKSFFGLMEPISEEAVDKTKLI